MLYNLLMYWTGVRHQDFVFPLRQRRYNRGGGGEAGAIPPGKLAVGKSSSSPAFVSLRADFTFTCSGL